MVGSRSPREDRRWRTTRFVLLSFGGPEQPDDVMPFLRNVTRGRGVPDERLAEVAEHYYHFGGVSPINQQCRDLLAAIDADFAAHGVTCPTYWGNRNWQPMLADTVAQMRDDGVEPALGFATSAYGGYSSCRQYWEDIARARAKVGPGAPADRQAAAVLRPPRLRRAARRRGPRRAGRRSTRPAAPPPGWSSPPTPSRSSMADDAGPDGGRYTAQLQETAGAGARAPPRPTCRGTWSGRAAPARRRCRGWSRTSTTT